MAVEQIISSDAWLLTQEPLETTFAEYHSTLPHPFSLTGAVDHVSGNGAAGIYIASAESVGIRTFSALVIDQSGTVSIIQGTMVDDNGSFSLVSATEVSVTNGGMGLFPNYMSYTGTEWGYTHSGGQGVATDTSVTSPEIGGIILFRKPGVSADLLTLAQINTPRVLSGNINFPNQGLTTLTATSVGDSSSPSGLAVVQYPMIHGIVGAPFGALDVDIGKSVPWTSNFVNDLFITDTNSGDCRYWVTEWVKRNQTTKFLSLGVDYFSDPVGWRQAQFAAADAAWNYSNDDWVLFIDSTEGLSCDTRTPPNDVEIDPFKSYIQTEIARAETLGLTSISIPFFAYVRDADIPDPRRFLELADPSDVQDWLQQSGSNLSVDSVNISVIEAITPYYYQQQDVSKRGLARLIKVSALRSGFNWAAIDTLSVPNDGVGIQIISYAYASWVNPATGENDGLKMRAKISSVRSLAGMPSGGGGVTGTAGPYAVAQDGVLTRVVPSSTQTQPILTPLYPTLFRSNLRFGTWYPPGVSAPDPIKPPYAFSFPPPAGRGEAMPAFAQVNNGEDLLFAGAPIGAGTAYSASVNLDYSPASSSALLWIDAQRSSVSSGALTNLGTAGSAYNARFGSTTGVDSFDPALLTHTGTNYLYLPGAAGNYASTPDSAALDITGDLDLIAWCALDDWTPAASNVLISKFFGAGTYSYELLIAPSGFVQLRWSADGTTILTRNSTVAMTTTDGTATYVRATLDVDNGAGGHDVTFYTSPNLVTWTPIGTVVTTAGVTSVFASTANLFVGSRTDTGSPATGKFYRAIVRNGIGGTTVFDADFTTGITSGAQTTFTESSANAATVTINRATSGRKSVAVTRPILLFGTDDYLEVVYDPENAYVRTLSAVGAVQSPYASYVTGTATAGTTTTLTDTTKAWTVNGYQNRAVRITGGTGVGQVRNIASNAATALIVSTAWTTTPDATSAYVIETKGNVSGDIEIVIRCSLDQWISGSNQPLVVKRATGQWSYYLFVGATGNLNFYFTLDGSTSVPLSSGVLPFTDGVTYWIRFRRTASTGAWTMEYAADTGTNTTEPGTWTAVPSGSGTGTSGTMWQGTADVGIGGSSTISYSTGKFYGARVREGYSGTNYVYWDAAGHDDSGASYIDGTARSYWTVGTGLSVVNANKLNFGATDSFSLVVVLRQWGTQPSFGRIFDKLSGVAGGSGVTGYALLNHTANGKTYFTVGAPSTTVPTGTNTAGSATTFAMGDLKVITGVRDVSLDRLSHYYSNTLGGGPITDSSVGAISNAATVKIGGTSGAYDDLEVVAVAIWQKSLSTTDIANLVTYFGAV
jgi:hypothetical protein